MFVGVDAATCMFGAKALISHAALLVLCFGFLHIRYLHGSK